MARHLMGLWADFFDIFSEIFIGLIIKALTHGVVSRRRDERLTAERRLSHGRGRADASEIL